MIKTASGKLQPVRNPALMNSAFLIYHPYEIVKIPNDPDNKSYFITHTGQRYELYFLPADGYFDGTTYATHTWQFGFHPVDPLTKKMRREQGIQIDHRVAHTITAAVLEFFTKSDKLLLFVCDTHDNKEVYRNKLFQDWYLTFRNFFNATVGAKPIKRNSEYENLKLSFIYRDDNRFIEEIEATISEDLGSIVDRKY